MISYEVFLYFQEGIELSIQPRYGPQSGGTLLYIQVPTIQQLRLTDIYINGLPCEPLSY